eukprot:scaffold4060_cov190-Amphora_coffeaeformis.AAC.1
MEFSSFSVSALTRRRPLTPVPSSQEMSFDTTTSSQSQPPPPPPPPPLDETHKLQRKLGLTDIIFYGVGCSVGAGIYSLVGIGATLAGPSIALSFLVCGVACCFTSLTYAEFSARVPLAGSAYTFTYVSFGELCGWLVGWNLTLGYAVSAAVVARSWAEYLVGFLQGYLDHGDNHGNDHQSRWVVWLTKFPILSYFGIVEDSSYTCCPLSMVIIGLCTLVLITGVKESTRFNTAMTLLNLSVLAFVLASGVGSGTIHADNLLPLFPHGVAGMARGSGLVFFAYLGFDMVACLSEEVKNPARNMPIGIIGSLLVSMTIYVSVSIVVVGMAPISLLGEDVPIINALLANACCTHEEQVLQQSDATSSSCLSYAACHEMLFPILYFGSRLVSFGAIFGLTTATFSCLMGQPRIFYSMAQDGLLFKIYKRVHPKTGVPTVGTILTGIFTAIVACFLDLATLANAISLGTLQVFTFVNAGVILLRMRNDDSLADATSIYAEELPPLLSRDVGTPTSPIVQDPRAAAVVRNLGLVKEPSWRIRWSSGKNSLRNFYNVQTNGAKPIWLVIAYTACAILASVAISTATSETSGDGKPLMLCVAGILFVGMLVSAGFLLSLPKSPPPETFACPFVPTVPLLGILCNSYMMGSLPTKTWLMILSWLAAGLVFYFGYGIHHSELNVRTGGTKNAGSNKVPAGATSALVQPYSGSAPINYHTL